MIVSKMVGTLVLLTLLAGCTTMRPFTEASARAIETSSAPTKASKSPAEPLPSPEPKPIQTGRASWYGPGFHGKLSASGQVFNQNAMTAAHRSLPFGTNIQVTNLDNGKTVRLTVNDRGPYSGKRVLDVSRRAAVALDMLTQGTAKVSIAIVPPPSTAVAALPPFPGYIPPALSSVSLAYY